MYFFHFCDFFLHLVFLCCQSNGHLWLHHEDDVFPISVSVLGLLCVFFPKLFLLGSDNVSVT